MLTAPLTFAELFMNQMIQLQIPIFKSTLLGISPSIMIFSSQLYEATNPSCTYGVQMNAVYIDVLN